MNVFTYGSLMFKDIWVHVVAGNYPKRNARLYGYQRRKIRGEIYPAVIPGSNEDYIDGKIYLDVGDDDINSLDEFEGEYYRKRWCECELDDGRNVQAYVYVFKKEFQYLIEDQAWDPDEFSKTGIFRFFSGYKGFD